MTHLNELVEALQHTPVNEKGESPLSPIMELLLESGLHPKDIPTDLTTGPAEAFVKAFEAVGGLPRLMLFADHDYKTFIKLFARLLVQTSAPITPQKGDQPVEIPWPEWLTARRLAYQEAGFAPAGASAKDEMDDDNA